MAHLGFIISLTGGVSGVIKEDFAFFVGECIPDAHAFAISVPGALSLVGRAAGTP